MRALLIGLIIFVILVLMVFGFSFAIINNSSKIDEGIKDNLESLEQIQTPPNENPNSLTNTRPADIITGSAVINAPFYINGWNIETSKISLEIRQNGIFSVDIKNIQIDGCGETPQETPMPPTSSAVFEIPCNSLLTPYESFRGEIRIIYVKQDSALDLTSTGLISDRVLSS